MVQVSLLSPLKTGGEPCEMIELVFISSVLFGFLFVIWFGLCFGSLNSQVPQDNITLIPIS